MPEQHQQPMQSARHLTVLLIVLCVFIVLIPLLPYLPGWAIIFRAGLTVVLVGNLLAHRHRRYFFYTALSLVVLGIFLTWITLAIGGRALIMAYHVETALLLALTAGSILMTVVSQHAATTASIIGAILVYLLFGLSWALMYSGIHDFDEGAFTIPSREVAESDADGTVEREPERDFSLWVYFSFVTMSTLGYGDISPLSPFTQTLTWMQSVAGQFYLAVLVARLVSIIPQRERKQT